jgi:nucleotide-binding universal stress UspA family protein
VVVVPEPWIQPSMSTAPVIVGVASPLLSNGHVAAPGPETAVLGHAFDRAARLRVPLIVVCAWEIPSLCAWSPSEVAAWRGRHEAALDELLEPWRERFPELEVVARCVAEESEQALIDASRVSQLIVVGRHRGSHSKGLTLGGTTRGVLHRATRPVAVVPVEPPDAATREHDASNWGPLF